MAIIWAEGEGLVHLFLAQHAHLVQALRPRGVHLTVVQLVTLGPELRIRTYFSSSGSGIFYKRYKRKPDQISLPTVILEGTFN